MSKPNPWFFRSLTAAILLFFTLPGCSPPTLTVTPQPVILTPERTGTGGGTGRIAFASDPDGNWDFDAGDADIYLINADGSGIINLTNHPANDFSPDWSPDGSQLVFRTNRDGNHEIYVMNADGSNPVNLTNHTAEERSPAWSPDGTQIAFASNRDGNFEIYVMNADGSAITRLTNDPALDEYPTWSPDGGQIAFAAFRHSTSSDIYIMNANGSGQTRLTPSGGGFPDWSPDGSKIAFDTFFEGHPEIFTMNLNGTEFARISSGGGVLADWSPDNSMIAFTVGFFSDGPLGDIYIMNADGSGRTNLTNSPEAFDSEAVWQP